MDVLALAWEFPPRIIGGISRHVAELYPEIVKLGHTVHLLTVAAVGAPETETVDGVIVHRVIVPDRADFFEWVRLMNECMLERARQLYGKMNLRFDLLHAHDWLVAEAAIALACEVSVPLIATIHATEYGRCNGIHTETQHYIHTQEVQLVAAAQRVIVCTQYMKSEVQRALGCPAEKIDVVYNGLNIVRLMHAKQEAFDRAALRLRYAQPDEAIVYYVGRLTYEKGVMLLLEAAPKVLDVMQGKVKFVIIGSGDAFSILLQRRAWELGIADRVIFTGFMSDEDLSRFQTVADCAVFPSLYEPFGIVALESFAAYVPVVVSDTGGLPEVVRHSETGVVTYVNDAGSIAWGILRVLQDPEYRKTLVENAARELTDRFAWPRLARQTQDIFARTLSVAAIPESVVRGTA